MNVEYKICQSLFHVLVCPPELNILKNIQIFGWVGLLYY